MIPSVANPLHCISMAALAGFLLGGCANLDQRSAAGAPPASAQAETSPVERLTKEGIEALRAQRTAEAVTKFNRALSLAPGEADLHLLAGLAYHQDYWRGNPAARDLAEAGYITASQLDAGLAEAYLQLGRIYLDTKRFSQAQNAFLRVLDIEPGHVDGLYGLAVASYYARDLEAALGAIRTLKQQQAGDARIARAAAFIHAAAGQDKEALDARDELAASRSAAAELGYLDRRLGQWRSLHADATLIKAARKEDRDNDDADDSAQDNDAPPPSGPKPIAPDWSDCRQRTTDSDSSDSYDDDDYDYDDTWGASDETKALKALPSPCSGRPMPRMAIIDATIIRTEETLTTSRGVNLLDGLEIVFSWSNIVTRTITNGVKSTEKEVIRGLAVGSGVPPAGVTYVLNIANATDLRNDVLARPSLVALDRRPSMFFSGTNLTIAVSGQYAGGDIEEKPIGVSLSVTPTFIDDDQVLLSVKAARSDLQETSPGSFEQSLHTTRSSVTTNVYMRMNQTLVLSGLVEKSSVAGRSRTPGLGDVPILQYLFSSANTEEVRRSILIVLTPRRPADAGTQVDNDRATNDRNAEEIRQRLTRDLALPGNTLSAIRSLAANRYAAQFRSGDLKDDEWKSQAMMDRLLDGLGSFLYY